MRSSQMVALPPNPKTVAKNKDLEPCPYHGAEHMVEATITPSNNSEWLPVYVCLACYHNPAKQSGVWVQQPESTYYRLAQISGKDENAVN